MKYFIRKSGNKEVKKVNREKEKKNAKRIHLWITTNKKRG